MKVLSLFDGISCGMLALNRAGIPVEKYDAFEIDRYAVQVSKKNFPEIVHHGNVFDGDFTKFQGCDFIKNLKIIFLRKFICMKILTASVLLPIFARPEA